MFRGFLLLLVMAAFSINATAADSIKIGVNVPLTGFAASDGESALNGAKLAVSQINKEGGINGSKLELVVYDDQAKPQGICGYRHQAY